MEDNAVGQEILQRAITLKEESEEIERQLQFVSEQVEDLAKFKEGLSELSGGEKEILASIGRGVHVKAERKLDEKLFVEVGAGVVVKKSPDEISKIIDGQIKKFQEARLQLSAKLQEHANEFRKMLKEIEKVRN